MVTPLIRVHKYFPQDPGAAAGELGRIGGSSKCGGAAVYSQWRIEMEIVNSELLSRGIALLLNEAFAGPSGKGSWFTDEDPDSGILGTLERLSAAEASVPLTPGDAASAASHASHLRYALHLANRAMKGENPYRDADWKGSWAATTVSETIWKELKDSLRLEFETLKTAVSDPAVWSSDMRVFGMIGNIAHSAWHLGAIRQALGLVETPAPKKED